MVATMKIFLMVFVIVSIPCFALAGQGLANTAGDDELRKGNAGERFEDGDIRNIRGLTVDEAMGFHDAPARKLVAHLKEKKSKVVRAKIFVSSAGYGMWVGYCHSKRGKA
jgi:hypothetical protein